MGVGETIRGWVPVASPGKPGFQHGKPRGTDRHPQSPDPAAVRTLKEALTFIEGLHKAGRMEELAGLLRRSRIFREAWLRLQQSSPAALEGAKEVQKTSRQGETQKANLVPIPITEPGPALKPGREPGGLKAATGFTARISTFLLDRVAGSSPPRGGVSGSGHPCTMLLQVYQRQDGFYAGEQEPRPRISIRV